MFEESRLSLGFRVLVSFRTTLTLCFSETPKSLIMDNEELRLTVKSQLRLCRVV